MVSGNYAERRARCRTEKCLEVFAAGSLELVQFSLRILAAGPVSVRDKKIRNGSVLALDDCRFSGLVMPGREERAA